MVDRFEKYCQLRLRLVVPDKAYSTDWHSLKKAVPNG